MPDRNVTDPDVPTSPLPPPQRWQDKAACLDVVDVNWFAVRVSRGDNDAWHDNLRRAREVCADCPVRADCMADAVDHDAVGIGAGTTEKERRRPTARTARAPHQPIEHGTTQGYQTHRRRGEPPCLECRLANAVYHRDRRNGAA